MAFMATIKRIGGSTFARIPPQAAKDLGLKDGDTVDLDILPIEGWTADELVEEFGGWDPDAEYFDRRKEYPVDDPSKKE